MGTQAESWTDIYATTHEQRLAQSIQFAREELAAKYGAAETRAKYMKDLVTMYDKALTDAQKALVDYETSQGRGGKDPASNADATARLLGVMAQAGGDIAAETGKSAQRKLEAGAAVESRYRPTSAQSSAIGKVASTISSKNINAITNPTDMSRIIRDSLGESIAAGVFAPGTDASKTAAADLFSAIDTQFQNSTVYQQNKAAIQSQLKTDIGAVVGVDPRYTVRAQVDSDRELAIIDEQKMVGQTGTATSAEAARLAKEALSKIGAPISDKGSAAIGDFKEYSGKYFDLIAGGSTIADAKAAIKKGITAGKDKEGNDLTAAQMQDKFEELFDKTRNALTTSRDFDQAKLFDPTYVDIYARSIKSGIDLTVAQTKFGESVEALSNTPTEEQARTRGVEIYEPISPGLAKRTKAAGVILEERAQKARIAGKPQSDDDLMASRMLERSPQLPDAERVIAGASLAAIRELDGGWMPGKAGLDRANDPASEAGYRLYSNVKEKQLRDTSPKGIVQYAADLAGGDAAVRDDILREYYKHSAYEMRGTKVMKAKVDVPKAEVTAPLTIPVIGKVPEVDIKSEELGF